jgi:hypothetical protein
VLQELSCQREDDFHSTRELYKIQLEECNVLITEVHFNFLPTVMTENDAVLFHMPLQW